MTALVVPGSATQRDAVVWVGVLDEPDAPAAAFTLDIAQVGSRPIGAWTRRLEAGERSVQYTRVTVDGLEPGRRYRVDLRRAGSHVSDAVIGTLPEALPGLMDRPFTLLLGSCFARAKDNAGTAGLMYEQLPAGARPDLKVLCGDQVYLDTVSLWTLVEQLDEVGLLRRHLGAYRASWTQDPGFRRLLRDGPNLFSSDDHDFWNNAPNPSFTAPDTFKDGGTSRWYSVASQLYEAFQRPLRPTIECFEMRGLSILLTDTRIDRQGYTDGNQRFVSADDLGRIRDWAASLDGPGCLVVGQLPFSGASDWKGRWTDFGLPDFAQYGDFVAALQAARHSIVILTGDVHFGRFAVASVEPGHDIVEVVSSPMSLVFPIPPNKWHEAPDRFPAAAIPGVTRWPVRTAEAYRLNTNHFATIEFQRAGAFVLMRVKAWPFTRVGKPPAVQYQVEHWIR